MGIGLDAPADGIGPPFPACGTDMPPQNSSMSTSRRKQNRHGHTETGNEAGAHALTPREAAAKDSRAAATVDQGNVRVVTRNALRGRVRAQIQAELDNMLRLVGGMAPPPSMQTGRLARSLVGSIARKLAHFSQTVPHKQEYQSQYLTEWTDAGVLQQEGRAVAAGVPQALSVAAHQQRNAEQYVSRFLRTGVQLPWHPRQMVLPVKNGVSAKLGPNTHGAPTLMPPGGIPAPIDEFMKRGLKLGSMTFVVD